ncbi:MAG: nucleoside hydrolase, partial [Tannerella sp.]|nr:nucleoside hydrolase [Tannerella sp.]
MKNFVLSVLFTGSLWFGFGCSDAKQTPAPTPVSIIFDTDLGPDYDDVGALTILHSFADSGEVRILATLSSNLDSLVAPCIDAINTYYGRPDLPVGAPVKGVSFGDGHAEKWTEALVAKFPHDLKSTPDAPDAVGIYRQILAAEPDTSVVIVTVGFLTNLANLLESELDAFSPLTGKELVARKVKKLVSMAGSFPSGREFNVFCDSAASVKVFSEWSSPILLSGVEIGNKILTGKRLIASDIANTPAKETFSICLKQGDFDGRQSWDETAVLVAVRGAEPYFNTVKGRIIANPDGSNTWQDDPQGPHEHLTWKLPIEEVAKIIEDLMMHEA